ncbi:MAG: M43 family zinc metalloprotease [Chitinophagales bacterium]
MKRHILLLLFAIMFCFLQPLILLAQTTEQVETCGMENALNLLKQKNPYLEREMEAKERDLQELLQNAERTDFFGDEILTIPVVIHILYNTDEQNIHDSLVYSQLEATNTDFRGMNEDTVLVPDYFKHLVGDARIQFCLATRDPEGNPTSGITRTYTDLEYFQSSSGTYENATKMHYTSKGGHDIWDRTQYLNIWICNIDPASGTLAWAYLPGADPYVDGIVCRYNYFGRPTIAGVPYELGRTMTHEIGHWLNLWHTFNDASGNFCSNDYVADTPPQAEANYGCPDFPYSTCDNYSDMYMNHMDYCNDACTHMFTHGQTERMRTTIYMIRNQLSQSLGCAEFLPDDAQPSLIVEPTPHYCFGTVLPIRVNIKNTGNNTLSSLDITYDFDDSGNEETIAWSGSLEPNEIESVFVGISPFLDEGVHKMKVYTSNPNGNPDAYPQTDTLTRSFSAGAGIKAPFYEDFSTPYLDNGWYIFDESESVPFQQIYQATDSNGEIGGVMAVRHDFHDYFEVIGTIDRLESPSINLVNLDSTQLSFDVSYTLVDDLADMLKVEITNDCGLTYETIYEKSGEELSTRDAPTPASAEDWRNETIDISQYDGQNIIIRFTTQTAGGAWLLLDNVNVTGHELIIDGVTNIETQKDNIKINPTLTTDMTFIDFPENKNSKDFAIEIFDITGKNVTALANFATQTTQKVAVDCSAFSTGLYLVSLVEHKSNQQQLLKIYKQ